MTVNSDAQVFAFSGFYLDARQRLLFAPDGRSLPLSGRAFDTLLYLVEHPNELIDKRVLMKAVWPDVVVEENNLNQNISIVRRALGETPVEHRFVVTVPGRGFRFVPAVERLDAAAMAALTPTPATKVRGGSPEPTDAGAAGSLRAMVLLKSAEPPLANASQTYRIRSWASPFSRWSMLLTAAALLLLGGYLLARHFWSSSGSVPVARGQKDSPAAPAASVAVMPFANLTGEANEEYLSDGMAEELINELTRVPGLKVPARTSSFAYKGRNLDVRQIARDLGVATVLEGSVRRAGEHIRVTAQLVNAASGYDLWSRTYGGSFGDVFKLEDEISADIVGALKSSLNVQLPAVSAQSAPTTDSEAYRLYLQARLAAPESAIRLLGEALARDPKFARALATLATARVRSAAFGAVLPHALVDSERDAKQALSLDPNLAEAHAALGFVEAWRGNWVSSDEAYRRALQLAPNDAVSLAAHASGLFTSVGQMHRGLEEAREAYAAAPAASRIIAILAGVYTIMGMDSEALKYADVAAELDGSSSLIALARQNASLRRGHYAEAAEIILPTLASPLRSAAAASTVREVFEAFGAPGERDAASRALTSLVRSQDRDAFGIQPRQEIITWYVMLGDLTAAFDFANSSLDEFARAGTVGLTWGVLWSPEMGPFRKDRRFQAFVTRLKLPDYWTQRGPPDECSLSGDTLVCR
jgi:TolB-like protein/DNA-binding winged helix-turn-helix (wHTH) protein